MKSSAESAAAGLARPVDERAPRGSAMVAASDSPSARAAAGSRPAAFAAASSASSAAASVGPASCRRSQREVGAGGRARTWPAGTCRARSAPGRRSGWRRRGSCPSWRRAARAGRRAPSARSCSRRSAGCRPTRAAAAGSRRPPRGGSRWRWPRPSRRRSCRAEVAQPGERVVDGAGDPGTREVTTGGALPSASIASTRASAARMSCSVGGAGRRSRSRPPSSRPRTRPNHDFRPTVGDLTLRAAAR